MLYLTNDYIVISLDVGYAKFQIREEITFLNKLPKDWLNQKYTTIDDRPTIDELLQKVAEEHIKLPLSKLDRLELKLRDYIYILSRNQYSKSINIHIIGNMITLAKGGRIRRDIIENYKTALTKHGKDPDRGYLD